MKLLNFSHPLTEEQMVQLQESYDGEIELVWDELVHLDNIQPFRPQIAELVAEIPLSLKEWQTELILVNLPGYAPAVAVLLAEIHGRCGHFVSILRIRPIDEAGIRHYEVAEIINLADVRDAARPVDAA